MKRLSLFLSLFLVFQCAEKKVNLEENFKALAGDISVSEKGIIEGTGSLIFEKKFFKIFSKKSFHLSFKLRNQSHICFYFFANEVLEKSLKTCFVRNERDQLEIEFYHKDSFSSVNKGSVLSYKDKDGYMTFVLDIYNDSFNEYGMEDSQVLIWSKKHSDLYAPSNAILVRNLDSRIEGGFFWGAQLQESSIKKAYSSQPVYLNTVED